MNEADRQKQQETGKKVAAVLWLSGLIGCLLVIIIPIVVVVTLMLF